MKDKDVSNPEAITETQEQEETNEDGKERSRGKRRTAREIAQMFDQLKQRHLTRKKEWQTEKQELLKQAGLAEESKLLLVELKKLLKDLKDQLYSEETKRKNVEEEFENAKVDWRTEKERLLKIIANMESRRRGGFSQDRGLTEELDHVKTRLLAREKDFAKIQKSNTEIQNSTQELKHRFETEKQSILESHEGDKRNWEKTRQVMLDKIETLQEELRKSRIDPFSLHGSHVGSPFDDILSGLTSSPEMEDYFSCEQKSQILSPESVRQSLSAASEKALEKSDSTYGDFHRTVDQALNQIEKITQDLKQGTNEPQQVSSITGKHNLILSPHTSSSTSDNTHWLSLDNSPLRKDKGSKLSLGDKQQFSLSSLVDQANASKTSRSNYSGMEQKVIKENKISGNVDYNTNPSSKRNFKSPSIAEKNNLEIREMASPGNSTPSSGSCSIPTFTESSAESPLIPAFVPKTDESVKSSNFSLSVESPRQAPFTKIEKNYSSSSLKEKKRDSLSGSATKKLPSLHQQLLFGNASKQSSFDKDNSRNHPVTNDHKYKDVSPHRNTDKTAKLNTFQTESSQLISESVKRSTNQKHQNRNPVKKQFSKTSSDFVGESVVSKPAHADFVRKSASDNVAPASESINAPPVRPKPSVKIEKDPRGNVLRVISESGFTRRESPGRTGSFEDNQRRGRRRRTQDVTHDVKPLINDETVLNATDKFNEKQNHQENVEKTEEKESLGRRGKSWIKRRLSFLDNPPKENINKTAKKRESLTGKARSSSSRRGEKNKLAEISTSEESDGVRNQYNSRRKSGRKDVDEKKGKAKRYIRSKTDSAIDVKHLLSKFKSSQFSSKKPSIVKDFEKKLLENEVKTLNEEKSTKTEGPQKKQDSSRKTSVVRDRDFEDDDGYKGEDELDSIMQRRKAKAMTLPTSATLTRSPSIKSLQKKLLRSKAYSTRSFHKSLIDLSSPDNYIAESPTETNSFSNPTVEIHSPSREPNDQKKFPHGNTQVVRTSFDTDPKTLSTPDKHKLQTSILSKADRASPGCLSLPDPSLLGGRFAKKRLSWATNLQQSVEEECSPPPSPRYHNNPTPDRISTSSVSGILLKPKNEQSTLSVRHASAKQNQNSIEENDTSRGKGRMSQEMKKKAESLEKVLKNGPKKPRARRYKRSETQPIAWSSSSEESDLAYEPSRGMVKAQSMSSETFTKEFHDHLTPGLTSRFKKPTLANRRLPSRWKKKDPEW